MNLTKEKINEEYKESSELLRFPVNSGFFRKREKSNAIFIIISIIIMILITFIGIDMGADFQWQKRQVLEENGALLILIPVIVLLLFLIELFLLNKSINEEKDYLYISDKKSLHGLVIFGLFLRIRVDLDIRGIIGSEWKKNIYTLKYKDKGTILAFKIAYEDEQLVKSFDAELEKICRELMKNSEIIDEQKHQEMVKNITLKEGWCFAKVHSRLFVEKVDNPGRYYCPYCYEQVYSQFSSSCSNCGKGLGY